MENIVVIDGDISLQNHMDGEWDLNIPADGDPNVIIVESGGQTYPHYSGPYTVTPSASQQVLDTDGKVMDDDVTVQAVQAGSATTPQTIITADPTISVSSGGLITAQVSKTQQITPTVVEGYVETGTPGNVGVSGSNTEQLPVQGAQTIYPSSSDQSIASGKYLTGAQTFKGVTVSGLSADKILTGTTVKIGDADDDDRIANVVGTAQGGITPTGTKQITANGTNIDVAQYAYADVAVPNTYSAGDEGKVVSNGALVAQSSDTVTANDTYDTTLINSLTVNVSGSSGYTIDDIIDRSPITGAVSYEGNTTNLSIGCFANTGITSFSSSKITNIGNYGFYSCKSLVTVDLPNLVIGSTNAGSYMFAECTNLQSINMPKYKRSGGNTFQNCKKLQMVVVPNIDYQFTSYWANGCTELTTVDVGPNIGSNFAQGNAFSYSGINTLILRRTAGVISVGNNVFGNSPLATNGAGGDIYVPSALLASYQSATNWSTLNATWHAIEGSYYETHYADGTVIS